MLTPEMPGSDRSPRATAPVAVPRLRPGTRLPISAAATALGTSARVLRYREAFGLVAPTRAGAGRRAYGQRELLAAAYAGELEARYAISPKTLGFAVRMLSDPQAAADVRRLAELVTGTGSATIAALDFDAQKARRLLSLPPDPTGRTVRQ